MSRPMAWVVLAIWIAWLFALQGLFASSVSGAWTPDLGLVLLLALDARLSRPGSRAAALLLAAGRIAFTSDPPLAIVVGYVAVGAVAGFLREGLEIDRPGARAVLAGGLALVLSTYWTLAHRLALAADGVSLPPAGWAWSSALATAVAALLFAPLLLRLPGLSPLVKERRR